MGFYRFSVVSVFKLSSTRVGLLQSLGYLVQLGMRVFVTCLCGVEVIFFVTWVGVLLGFQVAKVIHCLE